MNALDTIGGARPLTTDQFATRAYNAVANPQRNPVKTIMDASPSVEETPPMLGIFNDIPRHQFRESEAHAWAQAGFLWVINDGEHSQWEGTYGRDQNAAELRLGLLPMQRLPREAISGHGDAFQLGARATMRPYGTRFEDAERYVRAITFPRPGNATADDRGGYPVRAGDRTPYFTPDGLRSAEVDTQGWIQFETAEYILDTELRDRVLDLIASQERNRVCGFVGPFDALMRGGDGPELQAGIRDLFRAAVARGVHMGRLVSPGPKDTPQAMEDAFVAAIEDGARALTVHVLTSDLPYRGASAVAEPFFRACVRCGF